MRKTIWIVLLMLLLLGAKGEITFQDYEGSVISFDEPPKKVCVLFSSFAQMWVLSGGEVAITVYESVERGFASDDCVLVDSGAGKNVDLETLIYNQPDFVIGSYDVAAHLKAKSILEKAGIPTALFRVESIDDYLSVMRTLTDITGNKEAFEANAEKVYLESKAIIEKAEKMKSEEISVLFVRSGSGYSSAKAKTSEQHFAAYMLEELGAENIADEVPVILDGLSFEEILMKDPDAIFISLMGDEEKSRAYMQSVINSKKWQMLTAVREGKVYFLEKDLFQFKPNDRWAEAYTKLFEMLYAETDLNEQTH